MDTFALPTAARVLSKWDAREQGIGCNITRWYNHVQHQPGVECEQIALITDVPEVAKKPKDKGGDKDDNNSKAASSGASDAGKGKKKDKGGATGGKKGAPAASDKPVDVSRMNFVVGKIVECEKHPNADSLYIEKIDLGEESGPRTIVSGLVKFVPLEEMLNRLVVVVANLKPSNLKSVKSYGMVLCGSNADHTAVELLDVPEGTQIGERVCVAGFDGEPDGQVDLKKKNNVWAPVQADLLVNGDRVATYKGTPLTTSAGSLTCKTLSNATIS